MTISAQWLAFAAVGVVFFVVGMLWPPSDDRVGSRGQHDKTADEATEDSEQRTRRGAAALASSR